MVDRQVLILIAAIASFVISILFSMWLEKRWENQYGDSDSEPYAQDSKLEETMKKLKKQWT